MTHNIYREKKSHMFGSCVYDYHQVGDSMKKEAETTLSVDKFNNVNVCTI